MYAGTTIRHGSGRLVGVHQKIDRIARRRFKKLLTREDYFPSIKDILYFEGNNGPDGLKRKNPALDKTWYFIDPSKPEDRNLIDIINDNIHNLSIALKTGDNVRAAFEAAWLAHAIVDGITPAHHYPLSDKIEELWGKSHHERLSLWEKNVIPGVNLRDMLSKNWEYWGAGGVFTTHGMFELGVASIIATNNYRDLTINRRDLSNIKRQEFENVLMDSLHEIDAMKMYDELGKYGWTQHLAKQIKDELIPETIRLVILAWYKALILSKSS